MDVTTITYTKYDTKRAAQGSGLGYRGGGFGNSEPKPNTEGRKPVEDEVLGPQANKGEDSNGNRVEGSKENDGLVSEKVSGSLGSSHNPGTIIPSQSQVPLVTTSVFDCREPVVEKLDDLSGDKTDLIMLDNLIAVPVQVATKRIIKDLNPKSESSQGGRKHKIAIRKVEKNQEMGKSPISQSDHYFK
ncbi:BRISC and BRCA1-A complex member 1 [Striga asiatica]|uniref:BRISC and BRCA1-A complex member 1 n=1 Tax=Striga asiatica TaxID=4170 RepID=A0A5A7QFG9_STRAF|nr:BRISC and BRCA1-A complex member 1 [Striga asiatica]